MSDPVPIVLAGHGPVGRAYADLVAERGRQHGLDLRVVAVRGRERQREAGEWGPLTDLLVVDGNAMTYILINAVKELHAMVQPLRAQVTSLLEQLTQVQQQIAAQYKPKAEEE